MAALVLVAGIVWSRLAVLGIGAAALVGYSFLAVSDAFVTSLCNDKFATCAYLRERGIAGTRVVQGSGR